jgi:hypothetical protein
MDPNYKFVDELMDIIHGKISMHDIDPMPSDLPEPTDLPEPSSGSTSANKKTAADIAMMAPIEHFGVDVEAQYPETL